MSLISQSDQHIPYKQTPDRAYPGHPPVVPSDPFERPENTAFQAYPDVPRSFISRDRDWAPFQDEGPSDTGFENSPYAFSYRNQPVEKASVPESVSAPQAEQSAAPEAEEVSPVTETVVQTQSEPRIIHPAEAAPARPEETAVPEQPEMPVPESQPAAVFAGPVTETLKSKAAPEQGVDPILVETRRQIAEQKARRARSFAPLIGDDDDYRYDDQPETESAPMTGSAIVPASRAGKRSLTNPVVRNLSEEETARALKATFAADIPQHKDTARPVQPKTTGKTAKKKNRKTPGNRILTALLILFICIFVFSLVLLILNLYPRLKARSEYLDLSPANLAKKGTVSVDASAPQAENSDAPAITREMLDYYISVNSDFIGWLDVPGTNIHYPVVHGTDNDYYLRHTFKKEYSDYGAIFMDAENNMDFNDDNSVLYGHNMRSGAMFHDVNTMHANPDFAKEHMTFTITTRDGRIQTYQIFSIYRVNVETDYRTANQPSGQARIDYFNRLKGYSAIDFGPVTFTESSKIVTFSTCPPDSADDWRVAVHALLIDTSQL